MILKKLQIELKEYGPDKGKHTGAATFTGELGEVTLKLSSEHIERIFHLCADGIIAVAKDAAKAMTCEVIQHREGARIETKG